MMQRKYILAIDQGTTGTTVLIIDHEGTIVSRGYLEFTQYYPHPGWVEHDAMEIWATTLAVAKQAMLQADIRSDAIAGIGITNQRETTLVWNRHTGQPVTPAIVWQCRRTAPLCEEMRAAGWEEKVRHKTGLVIDAYFSATKLAWILKNVPGASAAARAGDLLFGTVDSWLVWRLTGGKQHVTDYSNASRTMLYNIHDLSWDDDLLSYFDVPRQLLPAVVPSSGVCGYTDPEAVGSEIPIAGLAGDQQAALFGQACFRPGMAKNTYGTGCFLLMNTGSNPVTSNNGLLSTIAWGLGDEVVYALEGSVFVAGAAIQWLRDGLGILAQAADSEPMALSVPDNGGVYFVPAFVGLGAPYWNMYTRGTLVGMTRGTSRAHLVRAALEAIAFQSADVLMAMASDSPSPLTALKADGGAAVNNFLMQFQADILGVNVERPAVTESTAMGAAFLAGLATGFWSDQEEVARIRKVDRVFTPMVSASERTCRLSSWRQAVAAAQSYQVEV